MEQPFNSGETLEGYQLVQLSPEVGINAAYINYLISRLSKNALLIEARRLGLPVKTRTTKPVIIEQLMNRYRQFTINSPLNEFRFIKPVADLVESIARSQHHGAPKPPTVSVTLSPLPPVPTAVLSPLPPVPTAVLSPLPPVPKHPTTVVLSPLPPVPKHSTTAVLSPLPPVPILQPVPATTLPAVTLEAMKTTLPPLPSGIGFSRPEYSSLDKIYNMINKDGVAYKYRKLMNDPNIGFNWSISRLKDQLIIEAHNKGYLSDDDFNIHDSKTLRMIRNDISSDNLDRLINVYKVKTDPSDSHDKLALLLYKNGVGFQDLMYAVSNEPSMIKGDLEYIPKQGEKIEGVYERSGKVDKDQNNLIEPIPGNPYTFLNINTLRQIGEERDVNLPRGKHQIVLINILTNYDQVLPDWINQVHHPFHPHTRNQLYYLAAESGIDLDNLGGQNLSTDELRDAVKIGRIIMVDRIPIPARQQYQRYQPNKMLNFNDAYKVSNADGYVLNQSNISFPFSVFNNHKNREETLGYMAELTLYPANVTADEYKTIVDERDPRLVKKLLKQKYKTDDIMLLDDNNILFIATRGYILPNPNFQEIKDRYNKVKEYPISLIHKLRRIYNLTNINRDNTEDLKYAITIQPVHPLEPLAVHINQVMNDNKVALRQKNTIASDYAPKIGMIIPPNEERKMDYLWRNIHRYKNILTRSANIGPIDKNLLSGNILSNAEVKQLLSPYTDQEIFTHTGVYLPYESRNDIIDNVNDVRGHSKFFVPVVRACGNNEIVTTFEDTKNMEMFIVGYGTIFEYFCYNLDDFEENFREYPIEGLEGVNAFLFRKPNILAENFTVDEIQGLMSLLERYNNIEGVNNIIDILRQGIQKTREMTNYDKNILVTFNKLPSTDKPIIRRWLYQLFYTGMYMRRWKGPGNPYPVHEKDTTGEDPNVKVNEELQILGYYPVPQKNNGTYPPYDVDGITGELSKDGQKFVDELRSIEYVRGEGDVRVPRQENKTIGFYLDRVRKGNMCIRMASSILGGTGSYYLGVFFAENIPGYDPTLVARIV